MGLGKINTFIDIILVERIKDDEGFSKVNDNIIKKKGMLVKNGQTEPCFQKLVPFLGFVKSQMWILHQRW